MEKWTLQKREVIFASEYIELVRDNVMTGNGVVIPDYYYINTRPAVIVVAVDSELNMILKKEYRHPLREVLIELPAGTFEEYETDGLAVAKRELLEETGYVSEQWTCLGKCVESPSKTNTEITIYLARDAQKVSEQSLDITEDIEFFKVPLDEAVDMCMHNTIRVNSSVNGILKAAIIINSYKGE